MKLIYTAGVAFKLLKHSIFLWSLIALFFMGCDKFVEVDLPGSQLTANAVFEDVATANAAIINVYAQMRDAGVISGTTTGLYFLLGNYTDELNFYGNPQGATVPFYNNVVLPTNSTIKSLWNNSYNQIYGANAIIEGVTHSIKLPGTDRDQLKGEALFIRALIHFYLTNLYGSIPYIKTTNYQENKIVTKIPSSAIYTNCIDDLKQAMALIPASYKSADRTRPNKFAAQALLARIYLYSNQWEEAAAEATNVINNKSLYSYDINLSKVFLKESTTTIWQFLPATIGANTLEAGTLIFTIGPPPLSAMSASLLGVFSPGDQRRLLWVASVSSGANTWYYPAKYKTYGTGISAEYSIILRLSEMYLIRSEARAHSNDLMGSKEDLNFIRNKAGLPNTAANSSSDILNAILAERRVEFFAELGHRFFDLKRFNALDAALSGIKPGWNSFEAQFPLPEAELNLNKNLAPQNTGY